MAGWIMKAFLNLLLTKNSTIHLKNLENRHENDPYFRKPAIVCHVEIFCHEDWAMTESLNPWWCLAQGKMDVKPTHTWQKGKMMDQMQQLDCFHRLLITQYCGLQYCWWKKSGKTTRDVKNLVNNGKLTYQLVSMISEASTVSHSSYTSNVFAPTLQRNW